MERSDHIADMRRRLQEACHYSSGDPAADASAGIQQLDRVESADNLMATQQFYRSASPGDAGAGGELLVQDSLRRVVNPSGGGDAPLRVEEVATQVLRLRALKRQHEEFREQFSKAEHQLKRTPTHYFLMFQSYLEKHLSEPMLAAQLQQPFVQLIKGLAAACRVEMDLHSSEGLLMCSRRLFRDAHNFSSKLIRQQPLTPQESKYLAPCLLSGQKYKRVREKEVNACFDVISEWLSALYFHSGVSDEVAVVAKELEEQEALLCQLGDISGAMSTAMETPDAASFAAPPGGRQMRPVATGGMNKSTSTSTIGVTAEPASMARQATRRLPASPEAAHRSFVAERNPSNLQAPVRRNSAGSPTNRSTRTGAPPAVSGISSTSRAGGAGGGVQRMQSDKALTQVLKAIKESHVQSPENSPASRNSGSSFNPSSPMSRTSSRQLHGCLPTVPERCVSLPSTLLESMYGAPSKSDDKEPRVGRYAPGINRRVTAVPKLQ